MRFFHRTRGWEQGTGSRTGSFLLLSTGRWFWAGLEDCGSRVRPGFWTETDLTGFRVRLWDCVGFSP